MLFFEVFTPTGALSAQARRHITERMVAEVVPVAEDGSPAAAEAARALRALSWVVIHEPHTWVVGNRALAPHDPPRYLVRVMIAEGALGEDLRAEVAERVTKVLAEIDDDPVRLYEEPDARVHVIDVPDGDWGAFGRVMRRPT